MAVSLQTLDTLEFPKIREQLARYTAFSASRELALELVPSVDIVEIRQRLQRTGEARRLFVEQPDISIGGARDVRGAAQRARRGGVLESSAFLAISSTLVSARRLRGVLGKLDTALFSSLRALAANLPSLPALEDEIARSIGDDGEVLDSASPALARLRSEVRVAFGRLQDRLQNMLAASHYADAFQEPIITIRNGRYVLPVKAGHRRTVGGLVHDQSASGATLYIEPMAIVELNNRWRELQLAEEEEVARILAELSTRVGADAVQIIAGVDALAELDLAFAQAKYAQALYGVEPEMVAADDADGTEALLVLNQARHPLIDPARVVPISVTLGGSFRMLLITGPNTGGKTVALKTTGLLALMAQAGLQIPASAPSRLPVFGQIFADIGDEQSIEQSLSTFSSHMTTIIRILQALEARQADWESPDPTTALVLLDELGAGTDPVEGAALARAIIEQLLAMGVMGVATTHYAELKAFAYSTTGVENGSVEFNVETLAPTYRLTIGLPGRSNALAIATRLGLASAIVERARSTIAREDVQVEDLLAGIHRERETAQAEMQRAQELRADAEKYRDRLAQELRAFEQRRDDEWLAARSQIDDEFREARAQLRHLRDEFRSATLTRQWLEQADQRLQETRAQAPAAKPPPPARAQEATTPPRPTEPVVQAPRPLQVGDIVFVRSVGLSGEILSIDEEEQTAEVQVGGFRMQAELAELRRETKAERTAEARRPASQTAALPPTPDVSLSLDMRGWRAADVSDKLERYLNDAYLAGLPYVRLIHGKGTGALRQIVRDLLTKHPLVTSFGGGGQDGGEGVTIARLVER